MLIFPIYLQRYEYFITNIIFSTHHLISAPIWGSYKCVYLESHNESSRTFKQLFRSLSQSLVCTSCFSSPSPGVLSHEAQCRGEAGPLKSLGTVDKSWDFIGTGRSPKLSPSFFCWGWQWLIEIGPGESQTFVLVLINLSMHDKVQWRKLTTTHEAF